MSADTGKRHWEKMLKDTRLTEGGVSAGAARKALLAEKRLKYLRTRTAKEYLIYQALKKSMDLFDTEAFVPWVSYLFPPEILASYGMTPLIPELAAATLTGTQLQERVDRAGNRLGLARDLCSYHRTSLAALRDGLLPAPSICLGTTPLCLGKELLLDGLANEHGVPFYSVQVPSPPDDGPVPESDVLAVAEDLRRVHGEIGRLSGRPSRLEEAVRLSNQAIEAWRDLTEARLRGDILLNGRETFAFAFLGQMLWGTEEGVKGYRMLLEPGKRGDLTVEGDGHRRLMWLHTVPHHDSELFRFISSRGAVVALEEMCRPYTDPMDPENPFPGMARRLLEHPLWGTASRRARLVRDTVLETGVEGVVHFNHWGCRHGLGTVPVLKQVLKEAGIPFLALDGDALELHGETEDKNRTEQLEAFLEML